MKSLPLGNGDDLRTCLEKALTIPVAELLSDLEPRLIKKGGEGFDVQKAQGAVADLGTVPLFTRERVTEADKLAFDWFLNGRRHSNGCTPIARYFDGVLRGPVVPSLSNRITRFKRELAINRQGRMYGGESFASQGQRASYRAASWPSENKRSGM